MPTWGRRSASSASTTSTHRRSTSPSPCDRGVGYELLRDVDDGFRVHGRIATLPVTLFVDADGTIVRQTGVLEEDELREYAEELLG
jgi:hypothetical protein